jgi:Bacterial Ig-like domain/L,D-transpeptidase catalytic domain
VSFLGSMGGVGRISGTLLRHRLITATAGTAAAVIVAGCAFAVTSAGPAPDKVVNAGDSKQLPHSTATAPSPSAPPVGPLRLLSVTPAGGSRAANGGAPITVTFSSALSSTTPLPKLSPAVPGSWTISGATATFTPASGYLPGTTVKLTIPGGKAGLTGAAATAGILGKAATVTFTTGQYSVLRLQQILAQLGYLPLSWTASASAAGSAAGASIPANAPAADSGGTGTSAAGTSAAGTSGGSAAPQPEVADAYAPPAGTFAFQSGYPGELTSQWKVGADNVLDQGAIRAFENDQDLAMDGVAGPEVWAHLLVAAAKDEANKNGYTYALADQHSPETLTIWHNGKVIEHTLANTGVPGQGTADGTYPVYLRYQVNWMSGLNPDGSKYHDLVYWISYFNGGDAVHYFDRPGYGYYQSLGCVEVPWTAAKKAWGYMTYGSLVTVKGPES